MKKKLPKIYTGEEKTDERGSVSFISDFNFSGIKRFYQITNNENHEIRAFHGHMNEAKYAYVASGSALLCIVSLDKKQNPSKKLTIRKFLLSGKKPQIIFIPAGYANGFRVLEKNTKIIFFSNKTLRASLKDDFRYPYDYWGKEIWDL